MRAAQNRKNSAITAESKLDSELQSPEHETFSFHDDRILVVDDEPLIRETVADYLKRQGFKASTAASGVEALDHLRQSDFSLVISDIRMPGLNGLQLLDMINRNHPQVAVVMITAVADLQTAVQTMKQGAYDYITKPFNLEQVVESVTKALQRRRSQLRDLQITDHLQRRLHNESFALHSALRELESHRDMTLEALVRALDAREHETQCHSIRVQAFTVLLARQFGFEGDDLAAVARGALLHDIGKIGISDSILLKPGKLNETEWKEMRRHPTIGYDVVHGVEFLERSCRLVLSHHERFDGKGYPHGLSGNAIPIEARLFSVIDTYDAITSDRPYRKALSPDYARQEIANQSGTQFDPQVVELFLKISQEELDDISLKFY